MKFFLIAYLLNTNNLLADENGQIEKCAQKNFIVCKKLGDQEVGRGNLKEASGFYEKSCDKKNQEGCNYWGIAEYKIGNISEAFRIWKDSCAENYPYACLSLGAAEEKKGDIEEADKYFKQACLGGSTTACDKINESKKSSRNSLSISSKANGGLELIQALKIEENLKGFFSGFYQGLLGAYAEKNKLTLTEKDREQIEGVIKRSVNTEEVQKILVPIYEKKFTPDEIQELVGFYNSATGRKFLNSQGEIMIESNEALGKWSEKITAKITANLELLDTANRSGAKK